MISEIMTEDVICEKEYKLSKLKKYVNDRVPVLIYGNGQLSDSTEIWLNAHGIRIEKHIVLPEYQKSRDELLLEQCLQTYSRFVVVIAVALPYLVKKYSEQFGQIPEVDEVFYFGDNYPAGEAFFSKEYIESHMDVLEKVAELLSDDLSRKIMSNFLKAKLSGNSRYLNEGDVVKLSGTEYFNEIFPAFKDEIFIDGGAYNGDTYKAFRKRDISYKRYYAFEPDPYNYRLLKSELEEDTKAYAYNYGLYSRRMSLRFDEKGSMSSRMTDRTQGTIEVEVVDIDTMVPDATYIKLDIEGSELEVLAGAEQTIRCNKPKLAICCYHKSEDIWRIPLYIQEICPDYRMYYRLYQREWCRDLVLYAYVPEQEI